MSPAERQRRYRRRAGKAWVCPVEVGFDTIEFLIDAGLLEVTKSDDRRAVGRAVEMVLKKYRYASRPLHDDAA